MHSDHRKGHWRRTAEQPSCIVRACNGDGYYVLSGLEVEGISASEQANQLHSKTGLPQFAAVVALVMSRFHNSRPNKRDMIGSALEIPEAICASD